MDKKSLKITTGAMATAIFGVLLLLNRQTGNLFQDIFLFLYPIPMVAYSAMYGAKSSVPVLAAQALIAFLLGSVASLFYAATQALIGLVFGSCLYHKIDMTKTLVAVMLLSAAVNVMNTIVLGFLSGFDLNQQVAEMQTMMNAVLEQTGVVMPENMMSANYLKQMLIISMTLLGILQGFIVYEVSLLILKRLRFPVQKPKSVFLYFPPKWTGFVAFFVFFCYYAKMMLPFENEVLQNTVLTAGLLGYIYLICFGFIAILLIFKIHFPKVRFLSFLVCILGVFIFPLAEMTIGFTYIVSSYHENLLKQYKSGDRS